MKQVNILHVYQVNILHVYKYEIPYCTVCIDCTDSESDDEHEDRVWEK